MGLIVDLPHNEAAHLIQYYENRIVELSQQLDDAKRSLLQLQMGYLRVDNTLIESKGFAPAYNINWTWLKKAKYIIHRDGASTTNHITDMILTLETELDRRSVIRSVSAIMGENVKEEDSDFVRFKNERNEWIYDIKEKTALKAAL